MQQTIWKFPLQVTDEQTIEMPFGAQILCIQVQNNQPCLWALVVPEHSKEKRLIEIYGTGNPAFDIKEPRTYIGTFQMHGGNLVWHVFEYTTN